MDNIGTVLIVEDDPVNLGFMSECLMDIGYRVVTSVSVEEALAAVA